MHWFCILLQLFIVNDEITLFIIHETRMKEGDVSMKAKERFLAIVVALVLGLGVVLPGFVVYGESYTYTAAIAAENGSYEHPAEYATGYNNNSGEPGLDDLIESSEDSQSDTEDKVLNNEDGEPNSEDDTEDNDDSEPSTEDDDEVSDDGEPSTEDDGKVNDDGEPNADDDTEDNDDGEPNADDDTEVNDDGEPNADDDAEFNDDGEPNTDDPPTLVEVTPFGTNHPVWNATDLTMALGNTADGDTITLMDDIALSDIFIYERSITLVTNGFTLDVYNSITLVSATLLLDDSSSGELNVSGSLWATVHVIDSSKLEVTSVTTATTGDAIVASNGSTVIVRGDVTSKNPHSSSIIYAQNGSIVHVGGDITSEGWGVFAYAGAIITIEGDVTTRTSGVSAFSGGEVHVVNGTVTVQYGFGADAYGTNSVITVAGNVVCFGVGTYGVGAANGGRVYIGGNVSAAGESSTTVYADGKSSEVNIAGSAINTGAWGQSVFAASGGTVNVEKNVYATGQYGHAVVTRYIWGEIAEHSGTIHIGGDVSATGSYSVAVMAWNPSSEILIVGDVVANGGYSSAIFAVNSGEIVIKGDVVSTGGIYVAGAGSLVTVEGNVTSDSSSVAAVNGGEINIHQNVTSSGEWSTSVWASSGGIVNIGGNAIASGDYSSAVGVYDGGKATIRGNITATGSSSWGIWASGTDSLVTVEGSVSSYMTSVTATTGGRVDVHHNVTTSGDVGIGAWICNGGIMNIGGNITATGADSVGVRVFERSTVNIDGNVSGGARGVYAYGPDSVITISGYVVSYSEFERVIYSSDGAIVNIGNGASATGNHAIVAYASGTNSEINITGDVTTSGSYALGVFVVSGGGAIITGNIITTSPYSGGIVVHDTGSSVTVEGSVEADSNSIIANDGAMVDVWLNVTSGSIGVQALDGEVNVRGNVTAVIEGVYASNGGVANIGGNVTVTGSYSTAVFATGQNSQIDIAGNIIASGNFSNGAVADNGGEIIVSGTINSPIFAFVGSIEKLQADYITPTTRPLYLTYSNAPANPTSTVWVRGNLVTTTLTAATPSLPYTGGNNLVTLTGSGFGAANIRIAAFHNNTGSALYTQTPAGTTTQVATTLNFPANTANATRNYTIRISLDGGVTWLATPTATVAIAPDTTAPPPSNDATLSSLSTTPGILSPTFAPGELVYAIRVDKHITAIDISALANCPYATVAITGYNFLTDGQNTVTVLVTAQDGTVRTYTIIVTRASAIVRLHWHVPGMAPYIEIQLPEINATIPVHLRPTVPVRYGTVGNPGWAFLGWYEELFPMMHNPNNQNRAPIRHAERLAAIDLLANLVITEAMLDANSVFELHASWGMFGDVNGDGQISGIDRAMMQNFIVGALTVDDIILQTTDVNIDGIVCGVDRSLLQNHIMGVADVILGPIQRE